MSQVVTKDYDSLLTLAEEERSCFVPNDRIEHRQCNRLVAKGELVAPLRGMYARTKYWDDQSPVGRHLHMVKALSKQRPDWVFSHFTAAAVYGLYVSYANLKVIHRTVGYGVVSKHKDICCHSVRECKSEEVDGVRVTPLEQTVYDCMKLSDFKQALAIADSACRVGGWLPGDIKGIIDEHAGKYKGGLELARLAAEHANGASESGGESIARAMMLSCGYSIPELQVWFDDPVDKGKRFRVDFFWVFPDGNKLVGEFDGAEKYTNTEMTNGRPIEEVLLEERKRESHINALRYPVMRMSYADVSNEDAFRNLLDTFGVPEVGGPCVGVI